jgi:hypothetical protein
MTHMGAAAPFTTGTVIAVCDLSRVVEKGMSLLVGRAHRARAILMAVWRRLTKKGNAKRRRRNAARGVLPVYLSAPSHRVPACDIELPLDSVAIQAKRLGHSLGSVRTSILQDALDDLQVAEARSALTPEGKKLKALIEGQLKSRGQLPPR